MAAVGTFRLFGIPTRLDPSLLIICALLATTGQSTLTVTVAFIAGGLVSLITHELGHALAARSLGATGVTIDIYGYAGLTKYRMPVASRARDALVTAAGPAVGGVLGLCVWVAKQVAGPAPGTQASEVYRQLLFVTLGWSAINLLPVVPLDGGRLLEQILPGSAQARARVAGGISALFGAAVCLWFASQSWWYPAVLFGLLTAYGIRTAVGGAARGSAAHRDAPSSAIFAKVCAGDYLGAAADAQSNKLDPALVALIQAVLNGDAAARAQLTRRAEAHPKDVMARSCLMLLRTHDRDWRGVLALLDGPEQLQIGSVNAAFDAAYRAGAFAEAGAIGEAMLRVHHDPTVAYNTACCWSLAGNLDLALSALTHAVDGGWTDWKQIDTDKDLARLRRTNAFKSWRAAQPAVA